MHNQVSFVVVLRDSKTGLTYIHIESRRSQGPIPYEFDDDGVEGIVFFSCSYQRFPHMALSHWTAGMLSSLVVAHRRHPYSLPPQNTSGRTAHTCFDWRVWQRKRNTFLSSHRIKVLWLFRHQSSFLWHSFLEDPSPAMLPGLDSFLPFISFLFVDLPCRGVLGCHSGWGVPF